MQRLFLSIQDIKLLSSYGSVWLANCLLCRLGRRLYLVTALGGSSRCRTCFSSFSTRLKSALSAAAHSSDIVGQLLSQYPQRLLRRKNASSRSRSQALVKPHHAWEQYISFDNSVALNTVFSAAGFIPCDFIIRSAYSDWEHDVMVALARTFVLRQQPTVVCLEWWRCNNNTGLLLRY